MRDGQIRSHLLREQTLNAWRRCDSYGCSPHEVAPQVLNPELLPALLLREADLIEAAQPYLRALALAIGNEPHAVMIGDGNGIMLGALNNGVEVPSPGTDMSERFAGANGMGTAIAENSYVEIVGPEHFIKGFHAFSCQSTPIRGPYSDIVGVIAITLKRHVTLARIREILLCAAHGIEAERIRMHLDREIEAVLENSRNAVILESLRQDIMQLHTGVRLHVDRAARIVGGGDPRDVLPLVSSAVQLSKDFKKKAGFWRELARDEPGVAQPILLNKRIREIISLLHTEFSTRNISMEAGDLPVTWIRYDAGAVSRKLLHACLRVLRMVKPGAQIRISVQVAPKNKRAEVTFEAHDGKNYVPIISGRGLRFPLAVRLQERQEYFPLLPYFA